MHQIESRFSKFSRGRYHRTPILERRGAHLRGGGPNKVSRQINAYVCHVEVRFLSILHFLPIFVLLNASLDHKFCPEQCPDFFTIFLS